MELSEGKLFTIEALNRIEGFVWPDGADWARMDGVISDKIIHFLCGDHYIKSVNYYIENPNGLGIDTGITRAEFESIDGWVRHLGELMPEQADEKRIDYTMRSGYQWDYCTANSLDWESSSRADDIIKWRYSKPQAGTAGVAPTHNIESLIIQHKAARLSTLEARRLLEQAEAIEHSLLLSIEEWAESNGFDIRVLDEVKK